MTAAAYLRCFAGIARREALRFVHQRGRFLSALVRPLVWLAIFAAGFRFVLGVSISPPYETYVLYETYIAPGLAAMILLFQGMQSSLSMVYDREVGSMRVLLTSPLPRWWLLFCKLLAGVLVACCSATCSCSSPASGRWSRRRSATSPRCRPWCWPA
jgi:ABC-2 type transport system permease protein